VILQATSPENSGVTAVNRLSVARISCRAMTFPSCVSHHSMRYAPAVSSATLSEAPSIDYALTSSIAMFHHVARGPEIHKHAPWSPVRPTTRSALSQVVATGRSRPVVHGTSAVNREIGRWW